jgi:hypothetical protein
MKGNYLTTGTGQSICEGELTDPARKLVSSQRAKSLKSRNRRLTNGCIGA